MERLQLSLLSTWQDWQNKVMGKLASFALQPQASTFRKEGVVGGIRLLSPAQLAFMVRHLLSAFPKPRDWVKGCAVTDRVIYDLAVQPDLVQLMKSLLGDNVVLWGAHVVEQAAGDSHPWHTDIETSNPDAESATVWIGLQNTSSQSTLELITGSHATGKPVQQVAVEHGISREAVTDQLALKWAREAVADASLVHPVTRDGDALVFDGRIWHASANAAEQGSRIALVLQYATARTVVRMPNFDKLDWPFRYRSSPRPPVLVVCGSCDNEENRIVAAPNYSSNGVDTPLHAYVQAFALPFEEDSRARWKPYPLLSGRTRNLGKITAHISVLSTSHSPHPPHEHTEEELLIVLDGEADLIVPQGESVDDTCVHHVEAGQLVYYPSFVRHTIRNISNRPVTYLMFKWQAPSVPSEEPLPWQVYDVTKSLTRGTIDRPFSTQLLFEGATGFLETLHAHTSVAVPGAGYEAHRDAHDVALLMYSGTIKIGMRVLKGPGLAYFPASELHGLRNIGNEPARYLVFEFHSSRCAPLDPATWSDGQWGEHFVRFRPRLPSRKNGRSGDEHS